MSMTASQGWLKAASALLILVGLVFALAAWPPTAFAATFLVDLIKWPVDGMQSLASPEIMLINGSSGGMMVGWGVMLWLLADRLYPRDPALFRTILFVSLGFWFLVDSAASIMAGGALNVGLNIVFLALFALPVLLARPAR